MTTKDNRLDKLKKEQSSRGVEAIQNAIKKSNERNLVNVKELDLDKAEALVVDHLIKTSFRQKVDEFNVSSPTKAHLRAIKEKYAAEISKFLDINAIKVRNFDTTSDFVDHMVAELVGYSVLEDAFADPEISDIYVINYNTIFVEKAGNDIRYEKEFKSPEHFKTVLDRFLMLDGKGLNKTDSKKVDFVIYGDRGTATHEMISPKGFSMTIRKHKEESITLKQLLEGNLMHPLMSRFLDLIIDGEANLIYAGITGSGKTTSLRAIVEDVTGRNGKRTLVCEDTPELFLKNPHTLELTTWENADETKKKENITLQDIIYMALRQKPKYIIPGEIRGEEAMAAIEAMETGHSTLTTMHAGTPLNAINRLVTKYLQGMNGAMNTDIAERIVASGVDYIAVQDNILGIGRRVTSITEVSYDFDNKRVALKPIFQFNFANNCFEMVNRIDPSKANHLLRRGKTYEEVKPWIQSEDSEKEKEIIEEINKLMLVS